MFEIINKILVIIYVLAYLNVLRHGYYFIQAWVKSNEESPEKYKVNKTSLIFLGLSLAYIISSIFIGVTI
jgi:hypothetical protein